MKLFIAIMIILLLLCGCKAATGTDPSGPDVIITYPPNNSEFSSGSIITVTADATDELGIREIQFYINDIQIFIDEEEPYMFEWDTGVNDKRDFEYILYAKALNLIDESSRSQNITITLTNPIGNPPTLPSDANPENIATSVSLDSDLFWECSDPDGDELTYELYFGTTSYPPLFDSDITESSYILDDLNETTTYYWKIIAFDENQNYSIGNVWHFTTRSGSNSNFEWCYVEAGSFTSGQYDNIENIPYDYEIMKYCVTNIQYLNFLNEALSAGEIWIEDDYVKGYYVGDQYYPAENYTYYELGEPETFNYARISYVDNSFTINVQSGYMIGDFDDHPVVEVTWFGANAFADYYELRLPKQDEWEKAARGMTGYEYPWGDNFFGNNANYSNNGDPWDNGTTPVGYFNGQNGTVNSLSPYECYDMCGNVNDWIDKWSNGPHNDYRIIHGGSWNDTNNMPFLHTWYYFNANPANGSKDIGFRCIQTP